MQRFRGIALVSFIAAIPVSAIIGGPLSGLLLSLGDLGGMSSWRWMFIWEGIPSIILGILALKVLKDHPNEAAWLAPEERDWLVHELAQEKAETAEHGLSTFGAAAADWRVWVLAFAFFLVTMTTYGMTFWLPQIIKEFAGLSDLQVGFLTAIPFLGMLAGLIVIGWLSDRRRETVFPLRWRCGDRFRRHRDGQHRDNAPSHPGRVDDRYLRSRRRDMRFLDDPAWNDDGHRRGRWLRPDQHDRQQRRVLRLVHD